MPPDRLAPPFKIRGNDDAYWIEDATGRRFAYTYFRDQPIVGTGDDRLSRELALRTVKWIARQATAAGRK